MSKAHRELAPTARQVYGTNPAEYDAGRPDYPDRIYEVLAERCGLRDGSRVLEIGPGSGTATRHLLAVGAEVVAIEPNAALGSYLGETNPGQRLRVIQSTFEDAELEDGCFDLVTAATSFHWVDPESGFAKLGRVVRPGGWVAVWWTIFGDSTRPDPFRDATRPLIADAMRSSRPSEPAARTEPAWTTAPNPPMFELDLDARRRNLREQSGLEDVGAELIRWTCRMDAEQARRLAGSTILILRLSPEIREPLLDAIEKVATEDFGGIVERPFLTSLYTGRRPDATA